MYIVQSKLKISYCSYRYGITLTMSYNILYIDISYILILHSSLDHLDGGGDLIDHSSSAPIEKCCSFSETTSQHRQKQHHSILSKTTSQFITSQCFVQEVVGSIAPRKSKHRSTLFMKYQASHLSAELQRN